MKKYKIGIIGGAGYTGGELLRILINHPAVDISFIHSNSNKGNPVYKAHPDLAGETELSFTDKIDQDIDVLFLCVGHGDARKFMTENTIDDNIKVIDLSQDFRLAPNSEIGGRKFVYGLPELNREQIRSAKNIANPGCFATALQLGLLPLAKAGILPTAYTTGITGSTGAGQKLSASSHFSWRVNNIQAYKTLTHQHIKEILQSIEQLQPGYSASGNQVNFVPWRGDFARGIFISSQLHCELDEAEIVKLYTAFYEGHPFTHVSSEPIFLKQAVNTNKCLIQIEKAGSGLVVHSITDNLVKGASGQAVQNMNLMLGLEETAGLRLKANAF
ncbi:MAG TPA: N-acetyl-gamma-glutamyl-phosphate reductase [Flavitalea sp.]|nr:N-acetyl-gamma-glutamyl-phosphate reductase [Flavitalea sp.]